MTTEESQIQTALKKAGLRPTVQRIGIARYVLFEANHPTVDEVRSWAENHFPTISRATIYNTLNSLVEAGLLREFRFPHLNKTIFDHNTTDHYHFLDEDSDRIMDIEKDLIEIQPKLSKQFKIQSIDVLFRGKVRA